MSEQSNAELAQDAMCLNAQFNCLETKVRSYEGLVITKHRMARLLSEIKYTRKAMQNLLDDIRGAT